ncbi:MAG: EpsI family protein [Candidatus Syntrophoarchaeum sp.]|nr:EpsI family protein [Candidatus Syntrophoarchaeum sp.]
MNSRYTKHVATILTFVFMAILYSDVLKKLALDWWNDPNYSHGFLIPFISAYWIWGRRKFLRATHSAPSAWGLPVLFASGILYIVGHITGELFTQRFSFVTMLAGLALTWRGKAQWRVLWAPVLYLAFMIPLPYIVYDSIAFPLKLLATKVSVTTLQYLNQPIYSEGNIIFLPDTTLEVADACSGIRSLISILALSIIIAKYTRHDWPGRFLLVALSIPVVIFMNILRIVGTGLLAAKDPDLSTGFFHTFSGEIIFLAGIIFLLGIAMLMAERGRRKVHREVSECSAEQPACDAGGTVGAGKWWPKWAALGILIATFFINFGSNQVEATPLIRSLDSLPDRIGGFVMVGNSEMSESTLKVLGVDHYIMRVYRSPSGYDLWLYIGYFEEQKEGAMIHSPKHCYPGSGWSSLSSEIIKIKVPDSNNTIEINEYILSKGDARQLVYYWYQSRGRVTANEYSDRLYMFFDSLIKKRSDGALIRISGPADDVKKARKFQQQFINALYPMLAEFLPS